MGQLNSIQSLRAVAALSVFICHLFLIEAQEAERAEPLVSFALRFAHGVDLFFVISGFVIVWVASDETVGWRASTNFMFARISRVYPLWWLFAIAAMLAFLISDGMPWSIDRLSRASTDGPTHLIKSLLLVPHNHLPVLSVGWSLVHEIYFYVVFAVLILLLPAARRLAGILAWGAVVAFGAAIGWSSETPVNYVELCFSPLTLEFIGGALAAYLIKAGHHCFARTSVVFALLGLIAVFLGFDNTLLRYLVDWSGSEPLPTVSFAWRRTWQFGLPATMLVYGLVALEQQGVLRLRDTHPLVRIGDWSYALYLSHVLVIAAVSRLIYRRLDSGQLSATMVFVAVSVVLTLVSSAATYHWFERPVIALCKRYRWMSGSVP
ncbi:MAG: acyltransferase [Pseudomonadota bacterium]